MESRKGTEDPICRAGIEAVIFTIQTCGHRARAGRKERVG